MQCVLSHKLSLKQAHLSDNSLYDKSDYHYADLIMDAMASQITSLTIVFSTVSSDADQRNHQSSASLAFVWGIHRGLVNSPHKWPVTRKMFPFDDVIMKQAHLSDNLLYNKSDYVKSPLHESIAVTTWTENFSIQRDPGDIMQFKSGNFQTLWNHTQCSNFFKIKL